MNAIDRGTAAHKAYGEALQAEAAYGALLILHFGRRSSTVRYTPEGKGEPGSDLRRACDRKLAADKALRDLLARYRDDPIDA